MKINYTIIETLIHQAGQKLLQATPIEASVHQKQGIANFCTDYDLEIQRFLIQGLSEILPGATFFGEEDTEGNSGKQADGEYVFYIDPIDGTTNFMFGYHHSCVSVGLMHSGRMQAGFVYNPYVDEMYTAIRGEGCFLNGKRLSIENKSIDEGIVAFGCARYNEGDTDLLFATVKELYLRSLSVRNGGSAALDLCRIASGSNVAYLELKLQPYDYAAASVIIEEAGGYITQVDGSAITFDEPCSIVAGTRAAWEEVRQVLFLQHF